MIFKSIKRVAETGICVGCGVCMPICPHRSVKIVKDVKNGIYKPYVNSERCTECGLCVEACFGIGIDLKLRFAQASSIDIFNKSSEDPVLGTCSNCYVGYASDNEIRYNSASGGIVTALLLHILDEKMADGILVTKMNERKPLEPLPFIARNKSEVASAARSKYCPVPAGIALKTIMKTDGYYAAVGLPCHIYGIRKAESIYPDLAKKIIFHIGIFCAGMPSFLATEYLLRRLKVRREKIMKIEYRGEGWPGKMLIELKSRKDGTREKLLLPYPEYWGGLSSLFYSYGCALCVDGFNRFSDISCGDAWLPEYQNDNLGTSFIITRNKVGEQLISGARARGRIQIEKIERERVKQAQKSMIRFKTRYLMARSQLLGVLGKPIPHHHNINVVMCRPTLGDYIRCVLYYFSRFVAYKRPMWNVLEVYHHLRQYVRSRKGLFSITI